MIGVGKGVGGMGVFVGRWGGRVGAGRVGAGVAVGGTKVGCASGVAVGPRMVISAVAKRLAVRVWAYTCHVPGATCAGMGVVSSKRPCPLLRTTARMIEPVAAGVPGNKPISTSSSGCQSLPTMFRFSPAARLLGNTAINGGFSVGVAVGAAGVMAAGNWQAVNRVISPTRPTTKPTAARQPNVRFICFLRKLQTHSVRRPFSSSSSANENRLYARSPVHSSLLHLGAEAASLLLPPLFPSSRPSKALKRPC
jgi:hypothetical protein